MANEKRLIDADELVRFCENEIDKYENGLNKYERDYAKAICVVKKIARTFPTVDAVKVVRCKDCEHWKLIDSLNPHRECQIFYGLHDYGYLTGADDFCSYGERKDNV